MRPIGFALLALVGCTGDAGPEGPMGPQGPNGTGTPSLSAIAPNHAFPARSVDVVISGDDTAFDASTTVDFGAGITVDKLTVVSVTQLAAHITIDEAAALGTRDVTVMSNGSLVAMMGFEIQPSIQMQLIGGPLLAGDIALMQAASLDDQPLSSASLLTQLDHVLFLNTAATSPAVEGPQALVVLVEPTASGPQQLVWKNATFGGRTFVSDTTTLAVGARNPTPLTLPTSTPVVFDTRSKLFSVTAPSLGIVSGAFGTVGSALQPRFALLPGSGVFNPIDFSFGNRNTLAGVVRASSPTLDLILVGGNQTGTDAAHTLTLGMIHTPVAAVTPESASAHGAASPQAMTSPAIIDGTLAATDVDAYAIPVATTKVLELSFNFADPVLLTIVNAQNANLVTQVSVNGGGSVLIPNAGTSGNFKVVIEPANGQATTYTLSFRVP